MHLFYTSAISNEVAVLSSEESVHCSKALRLKEGELVLLTDGQGFMYEGALTYSSAKEVVVQIQKAYPGRGRRNFEVHLAIAPTKNMDRFEYFIEKAVEIGIDEITPLICEHSERKEVRMDRLEKLMISAMKQSQKAFLPKINPPISLHKFYQHLPDGIRMIAHCEDTNKKGIEEAYKAGEPALILIGPEGDFSKQEIQQALENAFIPVDLGESRLRTETAGIFALSYVHFINREKGA